MPTDSTVRPALRMISRSASVPDRNANRQTEIAASALMPGTTAPVNSSV